MEIVPLGQISPDQVILWSWGFVTINATILYTWLVMAILVGGSILVTRNLSSEINASRWQHFLEVIISVVRGEIGEMTRKGADHYIPLIGTLFLFICTSNVLAVVPGYVAPTSSMTTTAALATCVFIAVPYYGISRNGVFHYVKEYFQPNFIFFPFHVMGELSRTLALTVRLFGNIMSHEKVIGILLAVTPFLFPVVMQILGLLIGVIQAYIFAILSMVYIASALSAEDEVHHNVDINKEGVSA
ncbi:MAG: ATP synthase subunit a [Deltaproteobacteria bacterium ADurb.Bin151]|jgi:F-type H+-transporting ATPase subunit a|nr:F0F1 ATP synthase subunit A [Smithella sp.]OQB55318.1 MAG: ATP synthase subunit a [Deltaproteobacteria bacterium ADurb.Bin151]HNZ10477.1 F0F1 ATP synthase subunit A [Smithellaceae bacterium]HOG81360.1 F0F1 ATP synthase subunit A [Smithellaceae bacterium]HOQ42361.1 F0F1 ATP synthase subunit A [Smithellaceae bacterium]